MNRLLKNKELSLKLIISVFLLLLIVLLGYAFMHGTYHIAEEDESIYYNSAKQFSETGSVRATECNNEAVARVWQCNWYGPMYYLFFGSIAKIAGVHSYNFLISNVLCLLLMFVLIFRANFPVETKLLITCAFLALYAFAGYIFTYYPETLELLFAVILTLRLKKVADENGNKNKEILIYLLLVMFFALFRVSTVFWAFGILAFSSSIKDFLKKLGIGILCFLIIYVYIMFFNAPFYGGGMAHIMQAKFGIETIAYLVKKIAWNTFVFFTRNPFYDLLQIPILIVAGYLCFTSKNRFLIAACIISSIYFVVLLTLYIPYSFFMNKQTACLYPLVLIALFYTDKSMLKYFALAVILVFSPIAYLKAGGLVRERKKMAIENNEDKAMMAQLEQIKYKTEGGKPITILTLYREFDSKMPYPIFSSNLPASTADKYPIMYSYNFPIDGKHDSTFRNEWNFKTLGKIHIDYILSAKPLKIDSTTMIYSCDLYYLYKNNKKTK